MGRVRAGTVFRLYSREAYETYMKEFESGEILRMPLDSGKLHGSFSQIVRLVLYSEMGYSLFCYLSVHSHSHAERDSQ